MEKGDLLTRGQSHNPFTYDLAHGSTYVTGSYYFGWPEYTILNSIIFTETKSFVPSDNLTLTQTISDPSSIPNKMIQPLIGLTNPQKYWNSTFGY